MSFVLCFIKESYFIEHAYFVKMLDSGNTNKQSQRTHLCLKFTYNSNTFYIPLRNNLGPEIRKYGRIGHSLPSPSRPNAGLDFRYALVINSLDYIEPQTIQKIPNSQYNKLQDDISDIEKEFKTYLMGFIKAIKKNRIHREPLFRESSLINFVSELNDSHL